MVNGASSGRNRMRIVSGLWPNHEEYLLRVNYKTALESSI